MELEGHRRERPNRQIDEFHPMIRSGELEFIERFSDAFRSELQKFSFR